MRPDEADELFRLYRETALVAYAHIFPPDRYPFPDEQVRAHWGRIVARHGVDAEVIVAEVAGDVVGAVVGAPGKLESMFVVPAYWGTGAADELHAAALDVSRRSGQARCRLDVLEQNLRARRFYERHGWRRDGRSDVGAHPPHPVVVGYSIALEPS